MTPSDHRKHRSGLSMVGLAALWVTVAALATACLIYRNNEAVVVLTYLGILCLPVATGVVLRSVRLALLVTALELVVCGIWFIYTLAGRSPR